MACGFEGYRTYLIRDLDGPVSENLDMQVDPDNKKKYGEGNMEYVTYALKSVPGTCSRGRISDVWRSRFVVDSR